MGSHRLERRTAEHRAGRLVTGYRKPDTRGRQRSRQRERRRPARRQRAHVSRAVCRINYPYGANEVSCGATDSNPPYLMPDRLEPFERFDLPANSVRPIWLSLDIPAGTTPGVYRGTVDVSSEKGRATLRVAITVKV